MLPSAERATALTLIVWPLKIFICAPVFKSHWRRVPSVLAEITVLPSVGAFALAMHTPATLQEDGSWIWVYTHAGPANDSQIRLRGALTDDGVDWELRVSYVGTSGTVDNEVWFNGSTSHEGQKQLYIYKSLAPDVKGRHMEALIVQLEEDPEKEISVHEGEEFIFVLDGVVEMGIGEDSFELEPGDSVYYLSTTPHHIAAKSGKSTILAVLYEG